MLIYPFEDINFLREMISYINTYLIFDCKSPSYIKSKNQLAVLKNHVLNDHLERVQHPLYNDTDHYMCDPAENIWRINPHLFKQAGYIGFDDDRPAEADSHFITFMDEATIRDYLSQSGVAPKLAEQIVELAFKVIHHPKYFAFDKKKPPVVVDIYAEQENKLPKWFREMRHKQMDELYEKITAKTSNFSIEKGPGIR